jgi:ABC-type nitrate/sulfonate/bicarbonate transport system substrate-binding protein
VTCNFPQTHKDLRIIYTVAEIASRLIANKKDITSPADLKGKRIGTFPSTSAAHFVEKLLASAGLGASGYSVVSGSICSAAPCSAGTLPYMLQHGSVDAIGMWGPTVQLAIDAIGESNLAVFQNKTDDLSGDFQPSQHPPLQSTRMLQRGKVSLHCSKP